MINIVLGPSLSSMDRKILNKELKPKHGSGSTADRLMGNQKWVFDEWTERLDVLFPAVDYAIPNQRFWKSIDRMKFLDPSQERPSRLVAIPKTAQTPRLIAAEPTCMQYVQQAILGELVDLLEADRLSGSFLGFKQQWPNQALACIGSEDGSLATIDLSDASDRVGNWIVEEFFSDFPIFLEALQAARSRSTVLPSGEVIQLQKFASMGSATTFPVEAMVFMAIAIEGVLSASDMAITKRNITRLRDQLRVYGDDIIVPVQSAESVIESLELFGLKVNHRKSFWNGQFRESCGKEYWAGHDVSITRFRKAIPSSRHDVEGVVSTVATRNLLAIGDEFPSTVSLLDAHLESLLGFFPWVASTSTLLGRHRNDDFYQVDKSGGRYQRPLTRGFSVVAHLPEHVLDDGPALLKCLLTTIDVHTVDEEHLQRSGRPLAVSMKLGWAQPF